MLKGGKESKGNRSMKNNVEPPRGTWSVHSQHLQVVARLAICNVSRASDL
jgi:hypothetical protein